MAHHLKMKSMVSLLVPDYGRNRRCSLLRSIVLGISSSLGGREEEHAATNHKVEGSIFCREGVLFLIEDNISESKSKRMQNADKKIKIQKNEPTINRQKCPKMPEKRRNPIESNLRWRRFNSHDLPKEVSFSML